MTRLVPLLWLALAVLATGPALAQSEAAFALPAPVSGDSFGYAVDVDGDRMVVGVPGDDRAGAGVGAVVIYERTLSVWAEAATLFPPGPPNVQTAGHSVAIDGDRVLVGAPVVNNYTGAVYVYEFAANQWSHTATLTPTDPAAGKGIGWSLDLDGDRAVLGAPGDATGGFNAGAAYVFDYANGSWSQTAKLTAASPSADAALGYDVGVSGDRVIAGAPVSALVAANGAAHVFEKTQAGWTEAVLTASDGATGDDFGLTVAISGPRAVVGAPRKSVAASRDGRAYVFEQAGTPWVEMAMLDGTSPQTYRTLGSGVDVQGDRIVLGAHSSPTETTPGAAFVYDLNGASWTLTDRLTASDGQQGDLFGFAVATDGLLVAVGAYGQDLTSSDVGTAYAYDYGAAAPAAPLLLAADGLAVGRASVLVGALHSNAGLTLASQSGGYSGSYIGDLRAVGAVTIDRRNVVDGDVTAGGTLTVHRQATVLGTATGGAAVVPIALPGLVSVAPGGQSVTVGSGQTQALAPGAYNRVRVRSNASLTLTAGTYEMDQLQLNRDASVALDVSSGPIVILANGLSFSSDVAMTVVDGASPAPELSDRVTIATTQTSDLSVGARSQLAGTLEAPAALVRLRAGVAFTGALAARQIVVDSGTTLRAHGASAPMSRMQARAAVALEAPASSVGLSSAPNPFRTQATLTVSLAEASDLRLTVHDLLGREVRLLADGPHEAGAHRVALAADGLPAGVYLVRLATPEGVATQRVTLVR